MKAIIYCRVSTKEQSEQGFSLKSQEKECCKFAENNNYEVDNVFIEKGESAKTQDRTELQKLIKYAVENRKSLSALIIWKYDRLARNLGDQTELFKHFSSLKIRVLSATENNEENASGKLMRNIFGSFAQYENDIKSERTIGGMKRAVEEGRWAWRAPVGYKNTRDNLNKPFLVPTDESKFIVEAFKLAEKGLYKQTEIVSKLRAKGFKGVNKNNLNRILRNEVYAGLIKVSWFPDVKDAIHKPLVSKGTYFKVQLILDGKKPTITSRERNHPDFPLRNFIRCPKCEQKLTGGWSTGKMGVRYAYYHCRTKGCSLNIRKQDLETSFYEYLKRVQPRQDVMDLFGQIILDVWKSRQSVQIKEGQRLDEELKKLREKQDRNDELMIQGIFDEETYKRKSNEIKSEMLTTQMDLSDAKAEINDIEGCIQYCKYFISNIAELWLTSDHNLKQRFQILVFPEKIYYENKSFGTPVTALIFKYLHSGNRLQSYLVPPRGFEPLSHG
ncbi:MAG: recombinase family protein [Candidatus Scalindua sp.]|nr:recombinase family protein [Candidatus Scalindua sp.]